ncbi:hypothetical protein [Phenylobacterium sp. VNQ135]|uniref:hypothetical protein n=1 Tax=Phenylobacterium sp. VNQ135 TaxID=3400922 RepID=UPI003C2E7DE8
MPGDVECLDRARRARAPQPSSVRAAVAAAYVQRAEEALSLLPTLSDLDERAAVTRIVETWLALAEAELRKSSP